MRFATLSLLTVLVSAPLAANAADLDYGYLRGSDDGYAAPAEIVDWSGFYVGGHGGYSSAAMGYANVFQPGLANYFRHTIVESEHRVSTLLSPSSRRTDGASYGVFAGYNLQIDEVVVGIEADYTSVNISTQSETNVVSGVYDLSNNTKAYVSLYGNSSTKLNEYGTIRGRAGYAFGNVLPFVTAGIAIGKASYVDRAYDQTIWSNGKPMMVVDNAKDKTVAGVALGAGIDYAITPNILLRGEYQYVLFDDFDKHKINVNTVRGGAAVKF